MRIRILSAAEEDLEEGFRFYESQSPGLGSYFLDSLYFKNRITLIRPPMSIGKSYPKRKKDNCFSFNHTKRSTGHAKKLRAG